MKKIAFIVVLLLLVSLIPSLLAEEELPDPGITPDSWLYGLDRAFERISLALTSDKAAKAEKRLQIASERIAELRVMVQRGKPEFIESLKQDYERELNETESEIEGAKAIGRNVTLLEEHVANVTSKHVVVLQSLLDTVPDQAKPAIEHAINVSQRQVMVLERVRERKAGNVTQGKPGNVTTGKPENVTSGKPENKTTGKPENISAGKPENKTTGKPENMTSGKPENVGVGKPSNVSTSKPGNTSSSKPENKTTGKPENVGSGKPEFQ